MRCSPALLVLGLLLGIFGTARAAESLPHPNLGVPLPAEWEGVWTSVDSIYTCDTDALYEVVTRTDTLCAGEEVGEDPNWKMTSWLSCSGSADATQIHTNCQSNGIGGEACIFSYFTDLDATRSGDSAFWSRTTRSVWNTACAFNNACRFTHTHSTRIVSGPPSPCGPVPTAQGTWGKVKAHYR